MAAPAHIERVEFSRKARATIFKIPLNCSLLLVIAVYPGPLNAALAANSLQCQMNSDGVPSNEGADALIVPLPRKSNLQAIILILDAEAVPDRLPAVGERQRVFLG